MPDETITIDACRLTTEERWQLYRILQRAAAAPSLGPVVADLLRRAEAAAHLLVPAEARQAEMRRRLDAALTDRGKVRERWDGPGGGLNT